VVGVTPLAIGGTTTGREGSTAGNWEDNYALSWVKVELQRSATVPVWKLIMTSTEAGSEPVTEDSIGPSFLYSLRPPDQRQ